MIALRSRWAAIISAGLLFALMTVVLVVQGRRIQFLQGALEGIAVGGDLPEGTVVPPFSARDVSGQEHLVEYMNSKPKVFYVLSPLCSWCQMNSASINSLAQQIKSRYDVIGLAVSEKGLSDFIRDHKIQFPVYSSIPTPTKSAYHLQSTPETIVVSSDGKVLKSWRGAYADVLQPLIERFFSVQLPSMSPGTPAEGYTAIALN